MSLSGSVAVVTGAASGIGRSCAVMLAEEGASVCIVDISIDRGEALADRIRQNGGKAIAVQCDVSSEADTVELSRRVTNELHLNAGVLSRKSILNSSYTEWKTVIDINLNSVFPGLKYLVPIMPTTGGSIIVTSSFAGREGSAGMPAYVASKHGVTGLVKAAAAEFSHRSIRVNAICPGPVYTGMMATTGSLADINASPLAHTTMLNRVGEAREVAQLVCFLASSAASFITGSVILLMVACP